MTSIPKLSKNFIKFRFFFWRKNIYSYMKDGEYLKATDIACKYLEDIKLKLGQNSLEFIEICNILALLYHETGFYSKGEKLYQTSLQLLIDLLGIHHPYYAETLARLGNLYLESGKLEKAEELYQECLHIREMVFTKNHPNFAYSLINIADVYQRKGDYSNAEMKYKEAFDIILKTTRKNSAVYSDCANNLATLYFKMGKFDKAESLVTEGLRLKENKYGKNNLMILTNLINLAALKRDLCKYQEAENLYKRGLLIVENTLGKKNRKYSTILNNIAGLYVKIGRYSDAYSCYENSLKILKLIFEDKTPDFALTLNNLGGYYHEVGDYEKSMEAYQEALNLYFQLFGKQHPDYATILRNIGEIFNEMGDYEKSLYNFQKSFEIYQKTVGNMHPNFADLSIQYSNLLTIGGYFLAAEKYIVHSMKVKESLFGKESPTYAISLVKYAWLKFQLQEYSDAEELMREALSIIETDKQNNKRKFAIISGELGSMYLIQGKYDDSEKFIIESLKTYYEIFSKPNIIYRDALLNLGLLYAATSRTMDALSIFEQVANLDAIEIKQIFSIGSERQRLLFLEKLKWHENIYISFIIQYFSNSLEIVQSALDYVFSHKSITYEALAAQRDAILSGKYPHLRESLKQLTTLRMQIAQKTLAGPGKEGTVVHQSLITEWNAEKERLEMKLAGQIPEIKLEEKLQTSDRSVIAHSLPPASVLLEFFRFDEYDFNAISAKGQNRWKSARYCAFIMHSGDPDNISLIDLGGAEHIDQLIANYKSHLTGEGRWNQCIASNNQPVYGKSRLFSRVVQKESQREEEKTSRDIVAIVEKDDDAEIDRMESLRLYNALFAPLQDAIGNCSRLFIAPDGQICTIPFEIIPLPNCGFLIDRYKIHYIGVGRDLLRFTAQIPGKPEKAIIMASPDFDLCTNSDKLSSAISVTGRRSRDFSRGQWYFPPLPGTKVEGEDISSLLGLKPLLEQDALESRLKAASSPVILHIATHGFFQSDQEMPTKKSGLGYGIFNDTDTMERFLSANIENPMLRSGLVLAGVNTWLENGNLPPEAEDGILTAEDVTGLDLTNTDLAVLSACNTGMGDVRVGEGVFGLRRAFAIAGAKTLIMSLWKVPDEATKELMVDFYKRILAGTPKADALREAQLELRKKYPDPRDWGAFICQGDPGVLGGYLSDVSEIPSVDTGTEITA